MIQNKFLLLLAPFLYLLFFAPFSTFAIECGQNPINQCTITQSTTFNPGHYTLPDGIQIVSPNIFLDCNNSLLDGQQINTNKGITVTARNITIENCHITSYNININILNSSLGYNSILHNNLTWSNVDLFIEPQSGHNLIFDNFITDSLQGLALRSQDNLVYNNYFYHNDYFGYNTNDRQSLWNIAKTLSRNIIGGPYLGGNYWEDYLGIDLDGDGLGDTEILPYFNDSFPLVAGIYPWDMKISLTPNGELVYTPPFVYLDTDNNIHLIWTAFYNLFSVQYLKIDSDGNPLTPIINLSNEDISHSSIPSVNVDFQENFYVVWFTRQFSPSITNKVYYKKIDKDGNDLTGVVFLKEIYSYDTSVTSTIDSQGDINLFWTNHTYLSSRDNSAIYYEKIDPAGISLIPETQITQSPSVKTNLQSALDSQNNIHLLWNDQRNSGIYYMQVNSNGNVIIPDSPLVNDTPSFSFSLDPQDNIHLAFFKQKSPDFRGVYYAVFNSLNFQTLQEQLVFRTLTNYVSPTIALDTDKNIHFFFSDQLILRYYKTDEHLNNGILSTVPNRDRHQKLPSSPVIDKNKKVHLFWKDHDDYGNTVIDYEHSLLPQLRTYGSPTLGGDITFSLSDPLNPETPYLLFLALSNTTGFPLGDGRTILVDPDGLFQTSLFYPQLIGLQNAQGTLDAFGSTIVTWNIPNISALAGYHLYVGYVTLYPQRPWSQIINSISEVRDFTLLP